MLIVRPVWATPTPDVPVTQWQWVRSRDGLSADAHGIDAPALLPRDNDVVLIVPAPQVSWHQVQLPRMPQHRVRQALNGVLEERLLTDPADLHVALAPNFEFGQMGWVAATSKTMLSGWLAALQAAQRPVARIVPELQPLHQAALLQVWIASDQAWLGLCSRFGVACWPLPTLDAFSVHAGAGVATWARALAHQLHVEAQPSTSPSRVPASRALKQASPVSQFVDEAAVWEKWHRYSEPAALTQAEAALGVGFQLEAPAARWLRVAQSDWDLAQFDLKLSAQARRSQRLHQVGRHILHSRPWRAARWGVAALGLSAVSVVAALTWQEQDALNTKQQRIRQTLTDTFPHITLVLDAPVQMQRELTSLQRSRGQLGQGDIEVLLHDVGGSIPSEALIGIESNASVNRLRFAAGAEPVVQAVTAVLTQRGWQVQRTGLLIEAQRHTKNTGGF